MEEDEVIYYDESEDGGFRIKERGRGRRGVIVFFRVVVC